LLLAIDDDIEAAQTFDELYAVPESDPFFEELWFPAPAALEHPSQLFQKVGDSTFFEILRSWYEDNTYGNVSTEDFIALAEQKSGLDLGDFFQAWLYEEGRPASW